MLLANIYVARKIQETFPESSLLRRHPKPSANSFEQLIKAVAEMGFVINPETSKTLSDSLDACVLPADPYFNKLVRIMTTRCMMQAVYFCSGTIASQEYWHYGLATEIYTHFTSPIRRYSDLVVHRLLSVAIGYDTSRDSSLIDKVKTKEMSDILNYRNRQAQQAARSSVELYTNIFFRGKTLVEPCYIIRILKNGFSVLIPRYGVEGFVYSAKTGMDPCLKLVDSSLHSLDDSVILRLFQKVQVKLVIQETGGSVQRDKLTLTLIEPAIAGMNDELETSKNPVSKKRSRG